MTECLYNTRQDASGLLVLLFRALYHLTIQLRPIRQLFTRRSVNSFQQPLAPAQCRRRYLHLSFQIVLDGLG